MNILSTLLSAAQGGSLGSAASKMGIDESSAQSLLKNLVPALTSGMAQNVGKSGGLELLSAALTKGNHERYLDDPASLADSTAINDGNGILGHLLGSKDASRALASKAAQNTGLDTTVIKQFLPLVAAAAMGAVSKQTNRGAKLSDNSDGGALGLVGSLLDSDGDGSVADDLLSLGKKLF
jgi:hypothetical protein